MTSKINIAEILKDCPKGTELYSPLCGKCYFDRLNYGTIICKKQNTQEITFTSKGYYMIPVFEGAECMLFPSKDNRDWNTFQRPFKDGDIIANERHIAIFHKIGKPNNCINENIVYYHCWYNKIYNECKFKNDYGIGANTEYKFATEDEKQKLFDAIKENGYKWNEETKTLEKLIKPKFKAGDKIVKKNSISTPVEITSVGDEYYYSNTYSSVGILPIKDQDEWELVGDNINPKFKAGDRVKRKDVDYTYIVTISKLDNDYYDYVNEGGQCGVIYISKQDDWELVPNKFDIATLKPFDKVLVRNDNSCIWKCSWYSHYSKYPYHYVCTDTGYIQCVPYEGNEHLLGTTQDCNEYYKNWE